VFLDAYDRFRDRVLVQASAPGALRVLRHPDVPP
jgi:hypothetical protein